MYNNVATCNIINVTVPPYCPTACDTSITYFSLMALEDLVGIPILSQLRGKKLDQFKDQAGFDYIQLVKPRLIQSFDIFLAGKLMGTNEN